MALSKEVQDIVTELAEVHTVVDGTELIIDTLVAKIEANIDDPVALRAALDELKRAKTELAAANARGTAATGEAPVEVIPPA